MCRNLFHFFSAPSYTSHTGLAALLSAGDQQAGSSITSSLRQVLKEHSTYITAELPEHRRSNVISLKLNITV